MTHRLTSEEINQYCEKYTSVERPELYDLNRQTNLRTELPVMLSGHLQGKVLSMLSHMIQPKYILEIGTFTGYSAICLSEGLQPGGKLITIDSNAETSELCMEYIHKCHLHDKIEVVIGQATEIIPTLDIEFDLVFIDADKINYSNYFDLVIDKVNSGGYILADNVLYHGDVLDLTKAGKNAKAMHAYNEKINQDIRMESVLLPLRDGIMISRKK
jgi:caffeoyl-CoA O-methyltransferase